MRSAAALILGLMLLSLAGCPPAPPKASGPYRGLTDPIDKVIADINANNSRLPTLWAHHDFEATVVDDKNEQHFVNGYGTLQYVNPGSIRLSAKKEVTDLFDMGCNPDQFWLRLVPDHDTLYWGNMRNVGKPCAKSIPIRPDLVMQVLGIGPIDAELLRQPVPVMRFNPDADAYMFVWQVQAGDRWLAQKEIWYDRQTRHPVIVVLFDSLGRVVLRARLFQYKPVEVPDVDKKDWPTMATKFEMLFPDTGTKMSFSLSDMTLSNGGFPQPRSFRMPDPAKLRDSGVKVIQVDENCGS